MPNIINLCEKNKKSLGRTRFGPDARTDRVITIGRSPQSGGVLINNHFRHQWWNIKMPRTRWQFVTVKSLIWPWGQSSHCLEVVYLLAKYEKPILNDKKVTARTRFVRFVTDAQTSLTLRSKVTNNGTWHIVWRWSTYMPNMKSLSWMTKKLQPGHNLLRTHRRWDGQNDHYRGPNYLSLCMRSS